MNNQDLGCAIVVAVIVALFVVALILIIYYTNPSRGGKSKPAPQIVGTVPGNGQPWLIDTWYRVSLDGGAWSASSVSFRSTENVFPVLTARNAADVQWQRRVGQAPTWNNANLVRRDDGTFVDEDNPYSRAAPQPFFATPQPGNGPWCISARYRLSVDNGVTWSQPTATSFQEDASLFPALSFENADNEDNVVWQRSLNMEAFQDATLLREGAIFVDDQNPCTDFVEVPEDQSVFWISQNEVAMYSATVFPGRYSLFTLLRTIEQNMQSDLGVRLPIAFGLTADNRLTVRTECVGDSPCWPVNDQGPEPFRAIAALVTAEGESVAEPSDLNNLNALLGFHDLTAPAQYVTPVASQVAPVPMQAARRGRARGRSARQNLP